MSFTRIRDLLLALVLGGLAAHLLLRLFYSDLPPLPISAGMSLILLAAGEAVFGYSLRTRIRERPRTVQPATAVRAVALAKASSLLGALMVGGWLGVLVYVAPRRGAFSTAVSDTVSAAVGAMCALALVAAGLWLEFCCRTPDDRDAEHDEHRAADSW